MVDINFPEDHLVQYRYKNIQCQIQYPKLGIRPRFLPTCVKYIQTTETTKSERRNQIKQRIVDGPATEAGFRG